MWSAVFAGEQEATANKQHILSFEENAEALVHRGLVLSSVRLALLQSLNGAELSREPLKQSLRHMEGFKHPLVDRSQLSVDLNLTGQSHSQSKVQ